MAGGKPDTACVPAAAMIRTKSEQYVRLGPPRAGAVVDKCVRLWRTAALGCAGVGFEALSDYV
jgi:hypothetical protein